MPPRRSGTPRFRWTASYATSTQSPSRSSARDIGPQPPRRSAGVRALTKSWADHAPRERCTTLHTLVGHYEWLAGVPIASAPARRSGLGLRGSSQHPGLDPVGSWSEVAEWIVFRM